MTTNPPQRALAGRDGKASRKSGKKRLPAKARRKTSISRRGRKAIPIQLDMWDGYTKRPDGVRIVVPRAAIAAIRAKFYRMHDANVELVERLLATLEVETAPNKGWGTGRTQCNDFKCKHNACIQWRNEKRANAREAIVIVVRNGIKLPLSSVLLLEHWASQPDEA